jgi:hypothetical protein
MPGALIKKVDQEEVPIFQERMTTIAASVWYSYFQQPNYYASISDRVVLGINQGHVISRTWFSVATRASSKDRDRPTVLAGLLNLDLKKILAVKGAEERMRMLYSMLDEFPQDVLFLDGPRFEEDGLGWALKVCRFTGVFSLLIHDTGKITPRGLQITLYSSFIFPSREIFNLGKSNQSDHDQRRKDLEQWADESKFDMDLATDTKVLRFELITPMDLSLDETYGIILKRSELSTVAYCALVSLQATEDGFQYARYIGPGFIEAITLNMSKLPKDGYLIPGTEDDAQRRDWIIC